MSDRQLHLLVSYRISEARETITEASLLLANDSFRGSINRAYYAMFYALLGLLATKGWGTSKHSGAVSLFDREFVKTGIFPKELSRSLHRAFDERQANDYGEMLAPNYELAAGLLEQARTFVAEIAHWLEAEGFL